MAAGTIRFYEEKLRNFVTWCEANGVGTIDQVSALIMRRYFASLQERGYAPNTQNMLGRASRAFLRWSVAEKLVKSDPTKNLKIPAAPKEVLPALKPTDVQALIDAASDARAKAMVLFLLDTGLRAREFRDLNGGDVDVDLGSVRVNRGKTGKSRTAFLSPPTTRALLRYYGEQGWPDDDEPLWRNLRTQERLTDSGIRQVLNATAKAAGVPLMSLHDFRRTFALWHLRQGTNLHVLAKLMGHSDVIVLKRYLDLDDGDTRRAHNEADIVRHYLK